MGLFDKKEKKKCPICGGELKFFDSLTVADGEICADCEKKIRGKFDIEEYWKQKWGTTGYERDDYKLQRDDPLQGMSVAAIKDMIDTMKAQQAEILEELGSTYANIAKVGNCFTIAPKPLDVGMKRAKELKNKYVATSEIISGEFSRGDEVTVTTDGEDVTTRILDVIVCSNSSSFETELGANMGKHKAGAGTSAWILLDMVDGVKEGSLVQK